MGWKLFAAKKSKKKKNNKKMRHLEERVGASHCREQGRFLEEVTFD